jgi:hemolysin activation/secretion protein
MRLALVIFPALALALALQIVPVNAVAQDAVAPAWPASSSPVAQPSPQPPAPPADPAFDILEYQIEGNTVFSAREIERAVTPFLGEKRHFSDVEGARKALEDAYQRAGYQTVFVDIPEQRVAGGVVRLHVLEGKVGQARVSGSRYFSLGEIRAGAPQFTPGSVPDFGQVQQEMAQLNKLPDRQVSPILTPGRVPGTIDVNLSVKDTLPFHGDIEDDNHASPFTTANRTSASLHYDDLWQRQHSLAINYQVAPSNPAETNVVYATYLWRFAGIDDAVSLYGIRSNSSVSVVGSSTILGNAKIAGVRWIHPLGSGQSDGASYFHSLTLGFDRKDFAQTNIAADTGNLDVLPAITYFPLSVSYGGTLVRDSGSINYSLGAVTAPRGVFGNTDEKFRSRRVLGEASYLAWKPSLSADRWITQRWGVYGIVEGQWTNDALIPNEQFVTGGADSVRGYKESEVSGDRGARGTLEVRFYPLGRPAPDGKRLLYADVFFDGAQVRLVDPAGPQVSVLTIASTGIGLRAQGWYGLHCAFDLAQALRDGGHGVNGAITHNGTRRLEASVGYSF